ncbi:MAG: hypothetical protein R3F41_04955 [Gammaproteobacteria bacterium]|nr:hypothetical protein [Pseudomonadales bacterium]
MALTKNTSIFLMLKLGVLLFLVPSISSAQDSVFYMWNDLVNDPDMTETNLLMVAQVSRIELQIMGLYVDTCQEFQPESDEAANSLKSKLAEIGANVHEFLNRYTTEEINALGARINDMVQQNYENQRESAPEFGNRDAAFQEQFCSAIRTGILEMVPAVRVEIEKGI